METYTIDVKNICDYTGKGVILSVNEILEKRIEQTEKGFDWRGRSFVVPCVIAYSTLTKGKAKIVFMYDNKGNLTDSGKLIAETVKTEKLQKDYSIHIPAKVFFDLYGIDLASGIFKESNKLYDYDALRSSRLLEILTGDNGYVPVEYSYDKNILETYLGLLKKIKTQFKGRLRKISLDARFLETARLRFVEIPPLRSMDVINCNTNSRHPFSIAVRER